MAERWTDPHEFPDFERGTRHIGEQIKALCPAEVGFALFLFDFGGPGKPMTYISNAQRRDMLLAVAEWVVRQDRALALEIVRQLLQRAGP